jgi:hypothetical protein
MAPEATEPQKPLQEGEPIEQLVRQIVRLAQNTTQRVQTALLPHQEAGMQGLDGTSGRILHSTSSSDGAKVDAILIVVGKHDQLEAHEEASGCAARGPSNSDGGPLADHGADITDVHIHHHLNDTSMPSLPQHEPSVLPHHTDPDIRVLRDHETELDEQIEVLVGLRRRVEVSSRKRHRTSRDEL